MGQSMRLEHGVPANAMCMLQTATVKKLCAVLELRTYVRACHVVVHKCTDHIYIHVALATCT